MIDGVVVVSVVHVVGLVDTAIADEIEATECNCNCDSSSKTCFRRGKEKE